VAIRNKLGILLFINGKSMRKIG